MQQDKAYILRQSTSRTDVDHNNVKTVVPADSAISGDSLTSSFTTAWTPTANAGAFVEGMTLIIGLGTITVTFQTGGS